jgi:hypothetical protein
MTAAQPHADDPVVRVDLVATGVLVLSSVAAAVAPGTAGLVHAAVSIAAFVVGTVTFLWAYAIAVGRSRSDLIGIGGLYFLAGEVAPRPVRNLLRGAWAVQIVAVVAAASIRPFTSVAFGILAPMLGLGLLGLWGARHGSFAPRSAAERRTPTERD